MNRIDIDFLDSDSNSVRLGIDLDYRQPNNCINNIIMELLDRISRVVGYDITDDFLRFLVNRRRCQKR